VEDHPANQQVIAGQLDLMECTYDMSNGAEQAMQLLEEENYYDLILLDCNLPGRDGYQIALDIRAFELRHYRDRTPIIAISAMNTEAHFLRCRECGMDEVMTKPIRLRELAKTLAKHCPAALTQAQAGAAPSPSSPRQAAPAEEVAPRVDPAQLKSWLLQDADDFSRAADAKELRYLIHSIHRIKGVAQMYRLSELAEFSAGVEENLRSSDSVMAWPLAEWTTQLRAIIAQQLASD
jgi:two-component system sensor histidine kinase EvgS